MIIQETVLVILHGSNIQYYESLGYFIPRYLYTKNYHKVLKIKKGTSIIVKVSDLSDKSNVKILCKCDICGKENLVYYNNLNNKNEYICIECAKSSINFKEKISKTSKGRKHSKKTRRIMSQKCWFNGKTGILSPQWNVDLSDKERILQHSISGISQWKKEVKKRDNYTCQCCGYIGKLNDGIMVAHHLNNFSDFKEQRLLVENGITLCKDCHKSLHKVFGKKSIREDFEKFKKEQ